MTNGRRTALTLVTALLLAVAVKVLANIDGSIFTTLADGATVNGNIYPSKDAVYLNGGPQNSHSNGLPDGDYYFQVTDPSGAVLLSTDDIACRRVTVLGGRVHGASASSNCPHPNGATNPVTGSIPVQLIPYDDTPNPGGEYKVWLTPVGAYQSACPANHGSYGFCDQESKTDNFKVQQPRAAYVTVCKFNDADGNGIQGANEPFIPHWPITAVGVDGGTVNTQTNDDGCVSFAYSGFSDSHPSQGVTLTEGTFGPDWQRTAPPDGVSGQISVSGGVITVIVSAGDTVTAPYFGNHNPFCDAGCGLDDLIVSKDANPSYDKTFKWTIAKDVDKTRVEQSGTSATFNYTVTVTHDEGTISNQKVTGTIRVSNPGGTDITGVNVSDAVSNGGTCDVPAGANVTIPSGDHVDVPYACTYMDGPLPQDGTNTATAAWSGGSPTGTASVAFGSATVNTIDDQVNVNDSITGVLGTVSSTDPSPKELTYSNTVTGVTGTCKKFENTATFTTNTSGATDSASRSVDVCVGADLVVTKTATASYESAILKSVDRTLVEQAGGSAAFAYSIKVTEQNWAASGTISITNPNDWEDITAGVADVVDNGGSCSVIGSPVTVPRSDTLQLSYSCAYASAPSSTSGNNKATATWDGAGASTPGSSATGMAAFGFGSLTVTDTFNGGSPITLGTVTGNAASTTFTETRTIPNGLGGTCAVYPNVARIAETAATSAQTVTICNSATGGLTMGFWQNKNGQKIISGANQSALAAYLQQFPSFANLTTPINAYVISVIKAANAAGSAMNPMLKGQMLATALDVFFSDPALGGNQINAPTPLGGVKIDLTKGNTGQAFGGAASLTVSQLLAYAGSQSNVGGTLWYGNVKAIQELAKDIFDAINNELAPIAP